MSCKMTVFSALRQQSYWQRRWDSNPHALEHRSQIPACISNFITPLYFGAPGEIRTHTVRILSPSPLPVGIREHIRLKSNLQLLSPYNTKAYKLLTENKTLALISLSALIVYCITKLFVCKQLI